MYLKISCKVRWYIFFMKSYTLMHNCQVIESSTRLKVEFLKGVRWYMGLLSLLRFNWGHWGLKYPFWLLLVRAFLLFHCIWILGMGAQTLSKFGTQLVKDANRRALSLLWRASSACRCVPLPEGGHSHLAHFSAEMTLFALSLSPIFSRPFLSLPPRLFAVLIVE